jgi:hypothetical protein
MLNTRFPYFIVEYYIFLIDLIIVSKDAVDFLRYFLRFKNFFMVKSGGQQIFPGNLSHYSPALAVSPWYLIWLSDAANVFDYH